MITSAPNTTWHLFINPCEIKYFTVQISTIGPSLSLLIIGLKEEAKYECWMSLSVISLKEIMIYETMILATLWQRTFKFLMLFTFTKAKFCRSRHLLRVNISWKEKQTTVLMRDCRSGIIDCVYCQHVVTEILRDLDLNFLTLMDQMVKKQAVPKSAHFIEWRVDYLPHYVLITQMRRFLIRKNVLWLFYATHRICIFFSISKI